jgi:hypothetical protein
MPSRSPSTRSAWRCGDTDRGATLLFGALLLAACVDPAPPPRAAAPQAPRALAPALVPAPSAVASSPPAAPPAPAPAPEAELDAGPTLSAKPYLAPGLAARFPRRAVLARSGPMRLALGGRRFGDDRAAPVSWRVEGIVVEEHPRSLRLVLDSGAIRLVFFAPRAALHLVSSRAAWLALAPDRAADPAAGVRLAPGVVLDEIAAQGALHHVRGEASRVGFEGWLPDDAVGVTFAPQRFPAGGHEGLVAESTVVTSAAGEVIARLPPPRVASAAPQLSFDVTPRAGAPAGFQAIELRLDDIEVHGLVPSASYAKAPPRTGTAGSLTGTAFGSAGYASDTEHALLRKGAELLDDSGAPVGVALAESDIFLSYAPVGDRTLRWASLSIGPFGFCEVRVRGADVRPLRR